nr:casein kinase 1-like protein HD16 isoform X1 [Ipomoea batatas]
MGNVEETVLLLLLFTLETERGANLPSSSHNAAEESEESSCRRVRPKLGRLQLRDFNKAHSPKPKKETHCLARDRPRRTNVKPHDSFLRLINMKFDEEPNYAKLISFFDTIIDPCTSLRPIRIDGDLKVWQKRVRLTMNLDEDEQPRKKIRLDSRIRQHVEKGNEDGLYISCVASAANLWAIVMDGGSLHNFLSFQISSFIRIG